MNSLAVVSIFVATMFFGVDVGADMWVRLPYDQSRIMAFVGDSVITDLPFVAGVATWKGSLENASPDTTIQHFLGFATEDALKIIKEQTGIRFVQQKNMLEGLVPDIGPVWLVVIVSGKGAIVPVSFAPFGLGVEDSDGNKWHNGAVIFTDADDWCPWP